MGATENNTSVQLTEPKSRCIAFNQSKQNQKKQVTWLKLAPFIHFSSRLCKQKGSCVPSKHSRLILFILVLDTQQLKVWHLNRTKRLRMGPCNSGKFLL